MPDHLIISHYFEDQTLCEQTIAEIGVTNGFIVSKLIENFPAFHQLARKDKITSVKLEKVSQCKQNVWRFISKFSSGELVSVVIKIPLSIHMVTKGIQKELADTFDWCQKKYHNKEVKFYRRFNGKAAISGFPLPKIYFTQNSSDIRQGEPSIQMIIMEDLRMVAQDLSRYLETRKLEIDHLKTIISHLVNLHKYCMENENWKDLESQASHAHLNRLCIEALVTKETEHFKGLVNQLSSTFSEDFVRYVHKEFPLQNGIPEVIVHGDFCPPNVMVTKSFPLSVYSFIDFAAVFSGCPAFDLEALIWSLRSIPYLASTSTCGFCKNMSVSTQEGVESDLLKFYHEEMSKRMNESGRTISFTLQQFEIAYRLCKVTRILTFLSLNATLNSTLTESKSESLIPVTDRIKKAKEYKEITINSMLEAIQVLKEHAPQWLNG